MPNRFRFSFLFEKFLLFSAASNLFYQWYSHLITLIVITILFILNNIVCFRIDRSSYSKIFHELVKINKIIGFIRNKSNLIFNSNLSFLIGLINDSNCTTSEIFLDSIWFEHFITHKLCFDEIFAVFGTSAVDIFDLIYNILIYHEVVAVCGDLTALNHAFVNCVNRRRIKVFEVCENLLDFRPTNFSLIIVSVFQIEDNFFERNRPLNFRIFDGRLVDKMVVWMIIFDFEEERSNMNVGITKSVKCAENRP